MATKITPQGEVVGGGYAHPGDVLYAIAKALFGADAQGNVTIPDDLTAVGTGFANATFVAEINAKT